MEAAGVICWDTVALDQCGGPEVVVEYVIDYAALRAAGFPPEGLFVQQVRADLEPGSTQCTWQAVPDPPVGEALMVTVDAVDGAGNSSRSQTVCR